MTDFSKNGGPVPSIVTINCDGCCEPSNPGGYGGYGWIATHKNKVVAQEKGCLGKEPEMTNNRAEYAAIVSALIWLDEHAPEMRRKNISARILSDSLLAVNQITGKWMCNAPLLKEPCSNAKEFLSKSNTTLEWIPREQNEIADGLSREGVTDFINAN